MDGDAKYDPVTNRRSTSRNPSTVMSDPTQVPDGQSAPGYRRGKRDGVGCTAAAHDLPKPLLDAAAVSRVIEMAWEDRTPFEAIHIHFALDESAVIALMRTNLKPGSFRLWRERVRGRTTKHAALRPAGMSEDSPHQARHRMPRR